MNRTIRLLFVWRTARHPPPRKLIDLNKFPGVSMTNSSCWHRRLTVPRLLRADGYARRNVMSASAHVSRARTGFLAPNEAAARATCHRACTHQTVTGKGLLRDCPTTPFHSHRQLVVPRPSNTRQTPRAAEFFSNFHSVAYRRPDR